MLLPFDMSQEIKIAISFPPHRHKHVAEIYLHSDEKPPVGCDGTDYSIGEISVDNGRLEFEIYGDGKLSINCKEFVDALNEGMRRLIEIYPECQK